MAMGSLSSTLIITIHGWKSNVFLCFFVFNKTHICVPYFFVHFDVR